MLHQNLKDLFNKVISDMAANISDYVVNAGRDLSRTGKIPADLLMSFLVSQGSSGTKCEVPDFFGFSSDLPSASALNRQRSKLKPETLKPYPQNSTQHLTLQPKGALQSVTVSLLLTDQRFLFFSHPRFSTDDYFVSGGHSAKGFYSMHINAFYDLTKKLYTGAVIQPVHAKDITSKGLVGQFVYPDSDTFDARVNVSLVRSHSMKIRVQPDHYRRFVDAAASFDFIEYSSPDTYDLTFRVVRFPLSEGSYECIVTNLPSDEFPPDRLKETYSFQDLRRHISGGQGISFIVLLKQNHH